MVMTKGCSLDKIKLGSPIQTKIASPSEAISDNKLPNDFNSNYTRGFVKMRKLFNLRKLLC